MLAVVASSDEGSARASALASRIGHPLCSSCSLERVGDACLLVEPDRLTCRARLASGEAELFVDYTEGALARRILDPAVRKSPLWRAVGKPPAGRPLRVLDATLGLGRDALMLAAAGAEVIGVERSPAVAALVDDALSRVAAHPRLSQARARLTVVEGDARHVLDELARDEEHGVDVVVIDPMFPEEGRTAAVKKDLQILRLLVEDEAKTDDLADLLASARAAVRRVVVKRPAHALPLADGVSRVVEAKGMRFDVYLR